MSDEVEHITYRVEVLVLRVKSEGPLRADDDNITDAEPVVEEVLCDLKGDDRYGDAVRIAHKVMASYEGDADGR